MNGPNTIIGAERANAASPTMNGESVSWKASHPSRTRSIQRAPLMQSPDTHSRRYGRSRRTETNAEGAARAAAVGATLLTRVGIPRKAPRREHRRIAY